MSKEIQKSQDDSGIHPVDPLTEQEILETKNIFENKKDIGQEFRYTKIVLDEPSKEEIERYEEEGTEPQRRAFIRLRDTEEKSTYEAEIAVDERELLNYDHIEGLQPSITLAEFEHCEDTVKSHEDWQESVKKRGVENLD